MKRAILIATGAVGSLGAVMAVTPPQLTSGNSELAIGTGTTVPATPTSAGSESTATNTTTTGTTTQSSPTAKASATASAKVTAKPNATASATQSPTAAATKTATPTPTPTKSAVSASGTFTGDQSSVGPYGGVVVRITVSNGKMTDIEAISAPGGRNQRYTDMAVPTMRQRALSAQSANISGVSGASYTSYNFWKSLTSAIAKAGL
mgnify:CR=1 FL=1|jgi:uncharacterized protein with FMN-binding domain